MAGAELIHCSGPLSSCSNSAAVRSYLDLVGVTVERRLYA